MKATDTHQVKGKMAEAKGARPRVELPGAEERPAVPPASAPEQVKQNIVWIASYPRSGNTWIRVFIHNLLRKLSGDAGAAQDINRLHEHTAWDISAERFERLLGKPVTEATSSEISRVRPEVQRRLANSRSAPFFVKTHLCFGLEHSYPTINLNATLAAIYVVRNPLDVVISYAHHFGQTIDAAIIQLATPGQRTSGGARSTYELFGSWSQHVAGWQGIAARPVHLMRYEDMLADPTLAFRRLARFLRLAPTDDQLARAIARSSFAELRQQEEERGFNERPSMADQPFFRVGRSGQWREVLSKKQIADICRSHAPIMQRFGYMASDCGVSMFPKRAEDVSSIPLVNVE